MLRCFAAVLAAVLFGGSPASANVQTAEEAPPKPAIGLFTTMPIYWGEADALSDLLDPDRPAHWARTEIERAYRIEPLDVLDGEDTTLAGLHQLLLAQPRALAPAENVALDDWVRAGGHLLLFADPMMVDASRYALGDPRRAYDTVLLSPILARWGLRLTFDPELAEAPRIVDLERSRLPAILAGTFEAVPTAPDAPSECTLTHDALIADCMVGKGRALIVADATVLMANIAPAVGGPALSELMAKAFGNGEIAGAARSRAGE